MTENRIPRAALAALTLAAAAAAQNPAALLLSTPTNETTFSGSNGTALAALNPTAVAVVTPSTAAPYSAEKYITSLGWQTLAGDTLGAGTVFDPTLMGAVDALLVKPFEVDQEGHLVPRSTGITPLDVFVSPKADVGTFVSGAPGLRRGDCGHFRRTAAGNGQVEHFITAEQIIAAFGMFDLATGNRLDPEQLDLDAITADVTGDVFLSFEQDYGLRLLVGGAPVSFVLQDGGVAWLPAGAWTPDARGNVATVLAQRGRIAFDEPRTDAMVLNAAVADNAGACPTVIDDLNTLALDPNGGQFNVQWAGAMFALPNLLFSGGTLTGAGVLSTAAGGSIAVVNGVPLANACGGVTTGVRMGLAPVAGLLSGLETLRKEPPRFVLDSPTPAGLGGPIQVHVGTNVPFAGGGVFLLPGLGGLPVSASVAFANPTFPELYPAVLGGPALWVPLAPDGFGSFTGVFGPVPTPGLAGLAGGVLFQAVGGLGGVPYLSMPATIN